MKLRLAIWSLFLFLYSAASGAVRLNSGHNTMDIIWRINSNYIGSREIATSFDMLDGLPIFVHGREEGLNNYSEMNTGMFVNLTSENLLTTLSEFLQIPMSEKRTNN